MEKYSHGMNKLQNSLRYDPTNMDNIISKMYWISDKIKNFITKAMKNWTVKLAASGQTQAELKI